MSEDGAMNNPHTEGPRAPDTAPQPPAQRVGGLIPFAKVADVERSVAFYHHLGFTPTSIYKYRDRLAWAALQSGAAELMLEGSGEPIDAERQAVLFYLYSDDLVALRRQLLAAGLAVGEIEDGSPGPPEEMQLIDPDGYKLRIAQAD
jgi:catechol 2,3-dioxygenase-like lactoylglutathione lyase family enzyme